VKTDELTGDSDYARILVKMHEARADFNELVALLGFDAKRVRNGDGSVDFSILKDSLKTRDELLCLDLQSAICALVGEYEGYFEGAPESVALIRAKQVIKDQQVCCLVQP
jgi:hypothetical protein